MSKSCGNGILFFFALLLSVACARPSDHPVVEGGSGGGSGTNTGSSQDDSSRQKVVLNSSLPLRTLRGGVLESVVTLPSGTQVSYPKTESATQANYRETDGSVHWSSTGFFKGIRIVSVPSSAQNTFTARKIEELNATSTGAYLSATIGGWAEGVGGNFAVLAKGNPGSGFSRYYEASGKPKFSFTASVKKRFGDRLNKGVSSSMLSSSDWQKSQRVYAELKKAADRTVATPKSILMIDLNAAKQLQNDWESKRLVPSNGAWTIATEVTAVEHGFPNVPCAEFMSELVREAFQRAGYRVSDDFNDAKGNDLYWDQSAAVVDFSAALYKAGWVPWDMTQYRPPTGALLMHGSGLTPGHTYVAAGDDGRFIVDNGVPQGRDLRTTSASTIEMMYETGVFFLPPGVNPQPW